MPYSAAEMMWRQAARLFATAVAAREKSNFQLADLLTDAANRYLDRAGDLERIPPFPPSLKPQQPIAQQQQQIQPDKKGEPET
jgi:hypothetical protein